jgi:hypothetical protein
MRSGAFKRAIGLTLLYVGIFVALVVVQFSKSPGLSEKVGGLTVSSSYPKAKGSRVGATPESVRLSYAGLVFEISPKSLAESVGADGLSSPLSLSSAAKITNGVSIKLTHGVEIKAVVSNAAANHGAAEHLSLVASAPNGIASVRVRIASSRGARVAEAAGGQILDSSGSSYSIALGQGSLDLTAGTLLLSPGDTGLVLAKQTPVAPIKPVTPAAVATEKFPAPTPKDLEAFKTEISAWRDKAWSGLSVVRFDSDKLAWRGQDGLPVFSEKALVAYIAEAASRGYYPDAIARARGAKDKWPDKLGYLSAPYLGGLVPKMRGLEAADQAEVRRLTQLVADGSPTIFEKESLLRFLVDRSPSSLVDNTLRLAAATDPAKLTMHQAIGLLSCIADSGGLLKDEENPFGKLGSVADRIVAAVRKAPEGYYLVTEDDGSSDLRLSLIAGNALAAYGAQAAKPNLVGYGQGLIEGFLGLADAQGFTPAAVLAKGGVLQQRMGSLAPEEAYVLVAGNPYYPHEVSFARDSGRGLWAWTCSPSVTLQASPSRQVFTASFAPSRAHYMTFYGIKSFANIQLYDIDYSPDNDFESYDASGYLYDADKNALYLKMKHKKESEEIKLSYK